MRRLYRFYANVNLLNIILFLAIIVLITFVIFPQFLFTKVRFTLPAGKPRMAVSQEVAVADIQTPPLQDYAVIGETNLFHPERKLVKEVKPLPKPELILYGTIIGDGTNIAFIEDKKSPKTSEGRGKRQTVVKKGDVLSGFVLKDIEVDRIVLTRGEETIVVHLTETGKQRAPDTTLSSSKPIPPGFLPSPEPSAAPHVAVPPKPVAAPAAVRAPSPAPAVQTVPKTPGRGNYQVIRRGQTPSGQ